MEELLDEPSRSTLEHTSLMQYLPKRRWFGGKDVAIDNLRIAYGVRFGTAQNPVLFSELEVTAGGQTSRYQFPFGFIPEDHSGSPLPLQLALSRVRRGREVGLITDAFVLESFIHSVIEGLQVQKTLSSAEGEIRFQATDHLAALKLDQSSVIRYLSAEQSNSSVVVGGSLVLKMIRRVSGGIHPELEMGAYLTAAGYANISPLMGSVSRVDASGTPHLLMIAQGYLNNQGDAWEWTQNNLERAIRDEMAFAHAEQGQRYDALGELADFAAMLGQRLGEMHVALAAPGAQADFLARVSTEKDAQSWTASISSQVERALNLLEQRRADFAEQDQALVAELLSERETLLAHVQQLSQQAIGGLIMRVHGDLHLGQMLVVQGDAYLIDFEGEPARPLEERRAKYSPYKDVGGVLRSFDYAAAMAVRNVQSTDASDEAALARQRVAKRYLAEARQAFIGAYDLATQAVPHQWQNPEGARAALDLFSLEKAAYEIAYEAENRPSWLAVPLHGLFGLLSTRENKQ